MLLSESSEQLELLTENNDKGKHLYLEGVFMESERKNRNGRVYPKKVMEKAVDKYIKEYVSAGKALGELEHPNRKEVDLTEAALIIESLYWQGNSVVGKAKVLNTPKGNILRGLLEGGYKAGVSTRGTGSVVNESGTLIVQPDFELSAVDFVSNPSAYGATPNAIMEAEQRAKLALEELLSIIKA